MRITRVLNQSSFKRAYNSGVRRVNENFKSKSCAFGRLYEKAKTDHIIGCVAENRLHQRNEPGHHDCCHQTSGKTETQLINQLQIEKFAGHKMQRKHQDHIEQSQTQSGPEKRGSFRNVAYPMSS